MPVEALNTITGSFEDVAKAKEMARVFIEQGADIIMHQADQAGLGVIEAAKEKKIPAIGVIKDQSGLAPDTVLVSAFRNIPEGVLYIVKEVKEGNFQAKFYPLGAAQDVVGLIWNPQLKDKVPAEAMANIEKIVADLKAGKIDLEHLPQ